MDDSGVDPLSRDAAALGMDDSTNAPVEFDEITPRWLTATLRSYGILADESVVRCEAEPLPGVPSFTGSFRRLVLTYDRQPPQAPKTLIAKASTIDPEVRTMVHSMGLYQREAMFYRDLAATTPAPVPLCYFSGLDQEGRSLLLLEDLTAGRPGRSADCMTPADAELATDMIARVHARWWESPDLPMHPLLDNDSMMPPGDSTGIFLQHWPTFLAKLSTPVTADVIRWGDAIAQHLEGTVRDLFQTAPLTLIHHDYQGDNLIFDVDSIGSLSVIDWQLPVRGRGIIDLAYLLSGSLEPSQRARTETSLVTRYVAELAAHGVGDYTLAQAFRDYRRALLIPPARLVMAVGSSPGMTAHPGAVWEVLFDRQLRALADNVPVLDDGLRVPTGEPRS
ncbi:MAG TPA: phosphotransferase [Microlunatus sp.]